MISGRVNADKDTQRDLWGSVKWWLTIVFPHKSASHVSPALGEGVSVAWRNGSCVASEDCKFDKSISALTYSIGFGFWVNTTCCQGNCQEPTPLGMLPPESSQMGGQGGGGWTGGEFVLWEVKKAGRWGHHLTPIPQSGCPKTP